MKKYVDTIKERHEKFVHSLPIEYRGIPVPVLNSWERCRASFVDPNDGVGNPLNYEQLMQRRERNLEFIQVTRPQMEAMYNTVRGSGFVVNFIDTDGFILEMVGDPAIIDNAQALQFKVGANWSEAEVGTNAISLALDERGPIQVVGAEHYCFTHHTWTCSASPVFGPEGLLRGILNMSAPARHCHPHTLGMIIAGAAAVQAQLRSMRYSEEADRAHNRLAVLEASMTEGLLSLDQDGHITRISARLARQLGYSVAELIGQSARKLGFCGSALDEILGSQRVAPRQLELRTTAGRSVYQLRGGRLAESPNLDSEYLFTLSNSGASAKLGVERNTKHRARYSFSDFQTQDPQLRSLIQQARSFAQLDSTVVLEGESGTGKEIFAHAIHAEGLRADGPFIPINCAAIPRELMESELFGYAPGAFSGAQKSGSVGKFELAHKGTVFLDEIGEMPAELQTKLLRFLQDKVLFRVGGNDEIEVDVRIIAATNRDLADAVRHGEFREDLYYRLNVLSISIPPLRRRAGDIPLLIESFLRRQNCSLAETPCGVAPDAVAALQAYSWPGNVRELFNVLERAVATSSQAIVRAADLPAGMRGGAALSPPLAEPAQVQAADCPCSIRTAERTAILEALKQADGNLSAAARTLGIGRNTLYRKLRKLGIPAR